MNKLIFDKYNQAKAQYGAANVAQGTLKLTTAINSQISNFEFETLANVGTTLAGETRLQLQDIFIITHVGFFISNVASGGNVSEAEPTTWPNPVKLTAAVATKLQAVYNGRFSFQVGNIEYFDDLDMRRFYNTPNAQAGTLEGASLGAGSGTIEGIGSNGYSYMQGFIPMFPIVTINGQQDITWKVNLAASTDLAGASSSTNYAHLHLQGFKVTRS